MDKGAQRSKLNRNKTKPCSPLYFTASKVVVSNMQQLHWFIKTCVNVISINFSRKQGDSIEKLNYCLGFRLFAHNILRGFLAVERQGSAVFHVEYYTRYCIAGAPNTTTASTYASTTNTDFNNFPLDLQYLNFKYMLLINYLTRKFSTK